MQHALSHEPWWIFGEDGDLSGAGLLRPCRINAGVHELLFQMRQAGQDTALVANESPLPSIPNGFYSGRQFVFPVMQGDAPFLCRVPRLLQPAMARIVNRDPSALLAQPRLWIKIPMPPGVPALHHAMNGIVLHTMTASNVFARNRTIRFEQDGVSVPVVQNSGTPEHLVAPLAVMSVENEPYEYGSRPGANASSGRFEIMNGRLTLIPGVHSDGSPHTAANVRLWLTNGELGNRVGPGDITGFANPAAMTGLRLAPVTAASGGVDAEDRASEERRFADALLTRGRIVTRLDIEKAALAMDRRILEAKTSSAMERRAEGLRRLERLRLTLDSHGFSKPDIELPALQSQIEESLKQRLVHGLELEVEFVWN